MSSVKPRCAICGRDPVWALRFEGKPPLGACQRCYDQALTEHGPPPADLTITPFNPLTDVDANAKLWLLSFPEHSTLVVVCGDIFANALHSARVLGVNPGGAVLASVLTEQQAARLSAADLGRSFTDAEREALSLRLQAVGDG